MVINFYIFVSNYNVMSTILSVAFGVVGLSSILLALKRNEKFTRFLQLLLFAITALLVAENVGEGTKPMIYALIGLVGLNYVMAQVKALQKEFVKVLVPLISVVIYLFLFYLKALNFWVKAIMR